MDLDSDIFPKDRYLPLREIGRGASGVVYLCRDRLLRKKVAVKCLHSVTAAQLLDFQNEARSTSHLNHPGIVGVLDFGGTASGAPFMVMEYVNGLSLGEFINEHDHMTQEMCSVVFIQIASALAYAHDKGIFHRDLKGSNILLIDSDKLYPEVRLIDFGVAGVKHATLEPTILHGRTLVGTPLYMPPDQANGLPYSTQSEIYALGCVLFEALTGSPPFKGETALETINMHAKSAAPTLLQRRPDLEFSQAFEDIIACCLAKNPKDRFQSLTVLSEALDDAIGQLPPLATEETNDTVGSINRIKHPLPAVFVIVVTIGITITLFKFWVIVPELFMTSRECLEMAELQIARRQFDESIISANLALMNDNESVMALDIRALAYLAKGDAHQAKKDINLAISTFRSDPEKARLGSAIKSSNGLSIYTTEDWLLIHRCVIDVALGQPPDLNTARSAYCSPKKWERKLFGRYFKQLNFDTHAGDSAFAHVPIRSMNEETKDELSDQKAWQQLKVGDYSGAVKSAKRTLAIYSEKGTLRSSRYQHTFGLALLLSGDAKAAFDKLKSIDATYGNGVALFHSAAACLSLKRPKEASKRLNACVVTGYRPTEFDKFHLVSVMKLWRPIERRERVKYLGTRAFETTDEDLYEQAKSKNKNMVLSYGFTKRGLQHLNGSSVESLMLLDFEPNENELSVLTNLNRLKILTIKQSLASTSSTVTGNCLAYFRDCPLETLEVDYVPNFYDSSLKYIKNMKTLKKVTIKRSRSFSGSGYGFLKNIPDLTIDWTPATSSPSMDGLVKLSHLKELILFSDPFAGFMSKESFSKLHVAALTLQGVFALTPDDLESIAVCPNLKGLTLRGLGSPYLENNALASLSKSKSLTALSLDNTNITDFEFLSSAPLSLQSLSLNEQKLSKLALGAIRRMKKLKHLELRRFSINHNERESLEKSLPGCAIQVVDSN